VSSRNPPTTREQNGATRPNELLCCELLWSVCCRGRRAQNLSLRTGRKLAKPASFLQGQKLAHEFSDDSCIGSHAL
jgi:hypothetical protein